MIIGENVISTTGGDGDGCGNGRVMGALDTVMTAVKAKVMTTAVAVAYAAANVMAIVMALAAASAIALALAFTAAATAQAQAEAELGGDLQAQILYAYQTEDTNSLASLIQNLTAQLKDDSSNASLHYHLAHAQYRMGLIAGGSRERVAEAALADCIDELKPLLQQDVKSVEALVLQSACYSALADHKKIESLVLRSRASDRLKEASDLAPRNPRVVFESAVSGLARSKPNSADHQVAFAQLQLAAQLFDASSATSIDSPGWGHAEAYLALGRELVLRGDRLGARNWIEKSLIVAPEYKAAQRQLALLAKP
jgi:tetratricopeptide (TPR) repeat protein